MTAQHSMSFPNHKAGKDSWDDVAERGSSAAGQKRVCGCEVPALSLRHSRSSWSEAKCVGVRSCVLKKCILTLLSENQELERGFEM